MTDSKNKITLRSFIVGAIFAGLFAGLTVFFTNRRDLHVTANQIPVMPYALLFVSVLVINPLCRLVRVIRQFSVAEVMIIFMMGLVSSGISTFGLNEQLLPIVGSLFNRHWNNDQTEWNRYVEPFVSEAFFLSVPDIQGAALEYRDAQVRTQKARVLYETTLRYQDACDKLAAAEAELRKLEASAADSAVELSVARKACRAAADIQQKVAASWAEATGIRDAPPAKDALTTYHNLLEAERQTLAKKKQALNVLTEAADAKVEKFRRGLPRNLSAYPGILPMTEDDFASYAGRVRRLYCGRMALSRLSSARRELAGLGSSPITPAAAKSLTRHVQAAVDDLSRVSDSAPFLAQKKSLDEQEVNLTASLRLKEAEIKAMSEQTRAANRSEAMSLQRQLQSLRREASALKKDKDRLVPATERTRTQLEVSLNVQAVREELLGWAAALEKQPPVQAGDASARLTEIMDKFPTLDASLRRYLLGDIPWSDWVRPLTLWTLLIVLTYIVLMTFNVLIFRQWAYNEKLVYPLAELPEILAGHNDSTNGIVPQVFRSGLFWAGFAISAGVLSWNLLVRTQLVPGLVGMDLHNSWTLFIKNTPLQGLMWSAKSAIFFTMIGLSFLIPNKISFSLWFFYLLYMVQLLILVGAGYGINESSFPSEWWYTLNFKTAQGGGALIVFATVVLFKCRKYILCAFVPSSVGDLEEDERKELRTSSFIFLLSSVAVILLLWLGMDANPFYTVLTFFIIMVITIGLVRAVTEGGILGFQAWISPFHFIKSLVGMDKTWTAPSLFAPLMVYYSVLFLDIKSFIAPAMANSLKIRDDLRMKRGRFHLAIACAILVAMVVAMLAGLMMSYAKGADAMNGWFYSSFPRSAFDTIATMTKTPSPPGPSETKWIISGGVVMAALIFLRRTLFWLPHPIGLIMLVNPIMSYYWFSIFLGWIAKTAVTRYGNKNTYAQARCFFIGLIAGEIILVAVSMVVTYVMGISIGIDLNRN